MNIAEDLDLHQAAPPQSHPPITAHTILYSDQLIAVARIIAARQQEAEHKSNLAKLIILRRLEIGDLTREDIIRAFESQTSTPPVNPQHFSLTPGAATTPFQSFTPHDLDEELGQDVELVSNERLIQAVKAAELFVSTVPSTAGSSGQTELARGILLEQEPLFCRNFTTTTIDQPPPPPDPLAVRHRRRCLWRGEWNLPAHGDW